MSKTIESLITCPYYMSEDALRISCEGFIEGSRINTIFGNTADKVRVEKEFCCHHHRCPYSKMLDDMYEQGLK